MSRNWETQAVFNWVSDLSADVEKEHLYFDALAVAANGSATDLKAWVEDKLIGDDIYQNHVGLALEFIDGCLREVWWDSLKRDLTELS